MNIPDDRKYADTHEWIRVEGDIGTVGISDHAQARAHGYRFRRTS